VYYVVFCQTVILCSMTVHFRIRGEKCGDFSCWQPCWLIHVHGGYWLFPSRSPLVVLMDGCLFHVAVSAGRVSLLPVVVYYQQPIYS